MSSLFPEEIGYPEGFAYFPDFITREEEIRLYNEIQQVELHTFIFQGFEAKRKVASFGFDYSFDKRSLAKGEPIPAAFLPLVQKVAPKLNVKDSDIAELLVIEYPLGAVMNWHRDAPPFDKIAGI